MYLPKVKGEDFFKHVHPTIRSGNDDISIFTITHIFPNSGKYKLWVDFKPKGGNQIIAAFKFTFHMNKRFLADSFIIRLFCTSSVCLRKI